MSELALVNHKHPYPGRGHWAVSDVIGDPLDYITCPTVPDTSTFDDARRTATWLLSRLQVVSRVFRFYFGSALSRWFK
ncbi:MAG: DUF4147 domain-containing protein [Deltaproteobacteria bacterium]|nr:DUF4147 domain-containing protein [Deltaproteobacteria bacterium]